MSISSQLPPIPLAMAGASLRALAQAAGQTVEVRVLSQTGKGATQVQIGRQVLSLNLPQSHPVGATLTLAVQQTDGHLQLTLEGVRLPAGGTAPISGAGQNAPATQVQLSASARSEGQIELNPATRPSRPGAVPAAASNGGTPAAPLSSQVPAPAMAPLAPYGTGAVPQASPASTAPVTSVVISEASAPAPTAAPPPGATATPQAVTAASSSGPVDAANGPPTQMARTNPTSLLTGNIGLEAAAAGLRASVQPAATPLSTSSVPGAFPPSTTAPAASGAGPVPRTEIPYAVAAPVSASGRPVVGVVGSASTGLPPVGQAVSSSIVGQHAPPPNTAGVPAAQANQARPVPLQPQSPVPTSAQAALAQMVQQALPRQDSVVGLTTALTAAQGKFALPEPVAKAAQQVLAARVSLDGGQASGAVLKAAVLKSGVFQEALLAAGQGTQAAGDAKSALLGLRQSLGAWLGQQAPVAQVAGVAPPLRGLPPRARAGDVGTPNLPDDVLEAGRMLLERTEAALSRVRLHQNASLPDQNAARQDTQWSLDLPVVVAGQQHLLQMQIHKDPEGADERAEDRGWQIRFAINLSDDGEIGAQISLRGGSAGVLLWAERPETSAALSADVEALKEDLAAIGLRPGAVVIRTGAPATPARPAPSASGQHLDATR
ncbi:hypothetical protein GGR20_000074 [Devosia subaequoris]|uniref:Flagellar hook-length control protein-like C-terminal domain-containing protein n=1 Tax=Devosia subaequoris TaxID=395930 RepID=A0A7W6NAA1_9HYPH|nr:flagellar hook-length control protein FliK [Devosia subaequoris]MBB4050456.1 hypothetical protein [Devosia subaequoris]MCP1208855.1 flagellar hook-length control protein FliK [Devosia subaequoris]